MAKKKKTSFEWAAQSAIQKGIRRGDIPLVVAAFSLLWEKDRSWLLWRVPILAVEEYWPSAARMPSGVMDRSVDRGVLLDFLLSLALCPKDRSAHGLCRMYAGWVNEPGHRGKQARWMRRALELNESGTASRAIEFFRSEAAGLASRVVEVAKYRFADGRGGMAGDRKICLAAMVLALTETAASYDMPRYGGDIPSKGYDRWPWWCYDMHTKPGLSALQKAAERLDVDRDGLSASWLFGESLVVDTKHGGAWWMSSMNTDAVASVPDNVRWPRVRETVRQEVERAVGLAEAEDLAGTQATLPGI